MENDEYTRKTDGYLPTAEVAFIDEIFKANSAILNALLTLLNERLFDNGNQRLKVPLLCLVGPRCSLHALTAQHVVAYLCTQGIVPSFHNGNQQVAVPLLCLGGACCSVHALTVQHGVVHHCTMRHLPLTLPASSCLSSTVCGVLKCNTCVLCSTTCHTDVHCTLCLLAGHV